MQHITCNAILQQSVHKAGIKVIACANGTNRLCGCYRILLGQATLRTELDRLGTLRIDKVLAVEIYLRTVHAIGPRLVIHILKILRATFDDIGQLKVLKDISRNLHQILEMRRTIVYIVVKNGALLVCILQECQHLWTDNRVDGIERAKHHHIVRLDIGRDKLQAVVGMILIKDILGIVVLVQKRQRYGRFSLGIHTDVRGINMIILQKADDATPHTIVARFADKSRIYAATSKRYQSVEHRTARHSTNRLIVAEDDVQYSFSYSYYFSHSLIKNRHCFRNADPVYIAKLISQQRV